MTYEHMNHVRAWLGTLILFIFSQLNPPIIMQNALNLAMERMARILHDDWSIRLGENRSDQSSQANKHLVAMLIISHQTNHDSIEKYIVLTD